MNLPAPASPRRHAASLQPWTPCCPRRCCDCATNAPEYQARIWGIFERLDVDRKYEGTGIGLAIVRKGVERMGGSVGVESDGRTGSRFWVQLPSAAA